MASYPVPIDERKIKSFCKKHHIAMLALFGSILTTQFTPSSDVDFLVRFDSEYTPTLFDMVDIEAELSEIVGRNVDMKTANDLSPYFRGEVLASAKVIYG